MLTFDLKLSEDGDLMLGEQLADDEGYLLYYMNATNNGDGVRVTRKAQGNIPVRDIDLVYQENANLQLIKSRVQTDNPDWKPYPLIGANLSDLIGEINNPQTAAYGKEQIIRALTHGDAFMEKDIKVEAIPIAVNELLFDIQLHTSNQYLRYAIVFDFNIGITNAYEV